MGPALRFVRARCCTIRTGGDATNLLPLNAGFVLQER
jgi:hypothetical protein